MVRLFQPRLPVYGTTEAPPSDTNGRGRGTARIVGIDRVSYRATSAGRSSTLTSISVIRRSEASARSSRGGDPGSDPSVGFLLSTRTWA